ncbi:MAG: glycolate oxidase subunit GlcE [Alphaproteobacteria bacterium]|nr:glycolate oxidase subunit GlcE [Alphaproteobacteria bacterium]
MAPSVEPRDEDELRDAVAKALAHHHTLMIEGRGSKPGLGRPVAADRRLSLAAMSGITYYEPDELVLEAWAGTPLAEIEARLAENGQHLAFEPPDLGPLYGVPPGRGSIGGAVACNLSGARRPFAGAARDHVLGIRAVSGRGEVFASGGRVVKNVTGYDMSKLLTGSHGTLAVLSRVTLKVLPRSETVRTVLLFGGDRAKAAEMMAAATAGPWDVSAAAYVPPAAAARSAVDYISGSSGAAAFRLEGSREGVVARTRDLRAVLGAGGASEELHTSRSRGFWAEVASGALLPGAGGAGAMIWRLSLPPALGPLAAGEVEQAFGGETVVDWAGGLVWFALADPGPLEAAVGQAKELRAIVEKHGGHATALRAPERVRADLPVFHPEAPAVAALTRRVKQNFDPLAVLNPGRMAAGL